MSYEINFDDFSDELDNINDQLTLFCEKTFSDYSEVIKFIEQADSLLRMKGLYLDHDDIDEIHSNLEALSDQEAINFIIPVYKDNIQSKYNLVVTYYKNLGESEYEIDMELQYDWETETNDIEDDENL